MPGRPVHTLWLRNQPLGGKAQMGDKGWEKWKFGHSSGHRARYNITGDS